MLFCAIITDKNEVSDFNDIFMENHVALLRYANSILKNQTLAEDAVQMAFIRLAKNYDKIKGNSRIKTLHFLVVIVKNVSLTLLEKEKKRREKEYSLDNEEVFELPDTTAWSEYNLNDLYERIIHGLTLVNHTDRQILYLRACHNLSYDEIAGIVGINAKNVSVRLTRCRQKLKNIINECDAE